MVARLFFYSNNMSKFCEIISSESIMNKIRLLCFVMAICFTNGAKAQFYDRADEIYYYVEEYFEHEEAERKITSIGWIFENTGKMKKEEVDKYKAYVYVFNFDGRKAAELTGFLNGLTGSDSQENLKNSPTYYEYKVENTDYGWKFESSSYGETKYNRPNSNHSYIFSSNRNTLKEEWYNVISNEKYLCRRTFKRVDKSFFKVGRSRTPSGTLHE